MFSFKSLLAGATVLALSSTTVMADHYLTVINGCKGVSVTPTLRLTSGTYAGARSATLAPSQSTIFKLTDNGAYEGTIYNANNGTSSSALLFEFAASGDGVVASSAYALSNYGGFTLPQIAVAWPSSSGCATKRCYTSTAGQNNCDGTQAIGVGVSSQSAINAATSSCRAANTGITLYYCSSQV